MAARSVTVNFVNNSDVALIRQSDNRSHGIWTNEPPLRIEAGATVSWESESSGVATGTEAEVTYLIETGPGQTAGSAHFHWDNPFIGSNSYDESTPVGYKADRSGGGGDNATVNWTFDCSSSTCDGIPDDWKINGVTIDPGDGSGPQFINLPAMGATVNKPDIFVQLDWMADATHSHALSAKAIKTVVDAFANAPFRSRTGSIGINLHVDAGPASIMNFATNQTWGILGVITFFPAKIPAKLGGLTAPLPHHSAKKPSLSTHLERTWLQIAPSLLLSNRTACFIQPRPRAPWRLSGEKCTRKCYDPNKQHRRSIPFTLSSRSPSGSAKVPKIHRRSFVIRARRQDG